REFATTGQEVFRCELDTAEAEQGALLPGERLFVQVLRSGAFRLEAYDVGNRSISPVGWSMAPGQPEQRQPTPLKPGAVSLPRGRRPLELRLPSAWTATPCGAGPPTWPGRGTRTSRSTRCYPTRCTRSRHHWRPSSDPPWRR